MDRLGSTLAFIGTFWLLSFVAAFLLCAPALWKPLSRRYRFRLPTVDEARKLQQARPTTQVDSQVPPDNPWLYLLLPIVLPLMLALLVLILVPAFAAMWVCTVCMNIRYVRRAVYRALRRRRAVLAVGRSYPLGLAVFVRKAIAPY